MSTLKDLNKNNVGDTLQELLFQNNAPQDNIIRAFDNILNSKSNSIRDVQLSALFYLIMKSNPTPELIYNMLQTAFSMDHFKPLSIQLEGIDSITCVAGSGKKRVKTLNISTFSAITAATVGINIIKPGSTSVSSKLGSADLMQFLGLPIYEDKHLISKMIKSTNIAFFKVENVIPKFDSVYGGKFLTVNPLSFALPALLSPIKYDQLLYGLTHPCIELSVQVMNRFGLQNLMVVTSSDHENLNIDEMGLFRNNYYIKQKNGYSNGKVNFSPEKELGISPYKLDQIVTRNSPTENLLIMLNALQGKGESVFVDILSINAAAILSLTNKVENIREGFYLSRKLLYRGDVFEKLLQIVSFDTETSIDNIRRIEKLLSRGRQYAI